MDSLIALDYLLLGLIAISTLISLFRGFFREALSLASWLVAVWAAWRFGQDVEPLLTDWIQAGALRLWVARGGILLAVLLVGGLAGTLIRMLLHSTGLSGTDRALGTVFGFARGVLLAGLLIVILEAAGFRESDWWGDSQLVPYAEPVTDMIRDAAEDGLKILDELERPGVRK